MCEERRSYWNETLLWVARSRTGDDFPSLLEQGRKVEADGFVTAG
jgi:hypothetical protein